MAAMCLISVACIAPVDPQAQALCLGTPGEGYFAAGTFHADRKLSRFVEDAYSEHLRAMGEPTLQCVSRYSVYRFLWLRSFHHPVAVRIEQRPDGMHLTATELDGAGGYEPGVARKRIRRVLDAEESRVFAAALASADVWTPLAETKTLGADGARWVVEARAGERYRLHDVWTPQSGRIRSLGLSFLALTGWGFSEKELY